MSAEMYDVQGSGQAPYAQPAVDVLPTPGARKAKQPEPELIAPAFEPTATWQPPAADPTVDPSWSAHAPDGTWSAPPAPDATWGAQAAPPAPVPAAPILGTPIAGPAPTAVVPEPEAEPKKFFGMQVRRGKKKTDEHETAAAWPTDVGVPTVADAQQQPNSYPASGYPGAAAAEPAAAVGLYAAMDAATDPGAAPTQAPVEAGSPHYAPAVEPVATESAPDPAIADSAAQAEEIRALRAMLEASEGQRLAAESRAEQAMIYARQAQTQLQESEADAKAKINAAEAKSRTTANDVQDWQIRHREAETTIAELSQSLAGAEKRLAELHSERDELMTALEEATKPEQVETT